MKNKIRDSHDRLKHIREAIREIEAYVHNKTKKDFTSNHMLSSAVLFQFSVIGEAVNHVDRNFLYMYDYPWYKVRAFRNLISHEYFDIKLDAVWEIIIHDLPELKQVVDIILDSEERPNPPDGHDL